MLKISVAAENIAGVNFLLDVVETGVVSVGDDGVAAGLELLEVVDDEAAEEGAAVLEGGFVDNDLGAFGLDTLHDTLDGGLAEVIAIGFHCEAVNANHWNGYG